MYSCVWQRKKLFFSLFEGKRVLSSHSCKCFWCVPNNAICWMVHIEWHNVWEQLEPFKTLHRKQHSINNETFIATVIEQKPTMTISYLLGTRWLRALFIHQSFVMWGSDARKRWEQIGTAAGIHFPSLHPRLVHRVAWGKRVCVMHVVENNVKGVCVRDEWSNNNMMFFDTQVQKDIFFCREQPRKDRKNLSKRKFDCK
jgi:hypothetical protein